MKSMFDIIAQLPNEDIQIDRASKRRTFPCPSCGENVHGCRAVRTSPEKPFEQLGISIGCPRCGRFTVEMLDDGENEYEAVMETGRPYDMFSRARAADERLDTFMDNTASGRIEGKAMLAELAADFAEELRLAGEDAESFVPPYVLALRAYCDLVEAGDREYAEPLARLAARCNGIAQLDLLKQLDEAYGRIYDCRNDIAPAAFLEALMGESLIDALAGIAADESGSVGSLFGEMATYSEEFESLPAEERADRPYAAAEGWYKATCLCQEAGFDADVPAMAEKVVESIHYAHEGGAPEDIGHLMMLANSYRMTSSGYRETCRRMLSDSELWSEPLLLAIAGYTFAEGVVSDAIKDMELHRERILPEDGAKALAMLNEALQILEAYGDVTSFAEILPVSYWIRGVLADDRDDKKLACCYALYFCGLGLISGESADGIFDRVFATEDEDSPLYDWYEELIKDHE